MDWNAYPQITFLLLVGAVALLVRWLWRIRLYPFAPHPGDLLPQRTALSEERLRVRLVASCVLFALISVPLMFGWVPPNEIYGFRSTVTRSSPDVWYSANAFHGWALMSAAVLGAAVLMTLPSNSKRWLLWTAFIVPVCGAIIASMLFVARLR